MGALAAPGRSCLPAASAFLALAFLAIALLPGAAAADGAYSWDYPLRDLAGREVRLADWRGKPAILAMDHTGSAVVCSDTSRRLRALQTASERLGKRFEFIIISLDPATDTPEGWKSYLRALSLPDARWNFLRPSAQDAKTIAQRLGVKHWAQDGFLMHEVMIVRLDAQGRIVRRLVGYDRDTDRFLR